MMLLHKTGGRCEKIGGANRNKRQNVGVKFRYYEKDTKFEKNLPPVLTKQLFSLSSVKTSGRLFSNFCGLLRKAELYQQVFVPSLYKILHMLISHCEFVMPKALK